jgi:hypothetical protein
MENVRMRLLSFEQIFFWYYQIEKKQGTFLEVILDTDILSQFFAYYYSAADITIEPEFRKKTGASTIYNHFGHYSTFYKWFLSQKGYKKEKEKALQCYFFCTVESKGLYVLFLLLLSCRLANYLF